MIVLLESVPLLISVHRAAAGDPSTLRLPNGRAVTLEIASTPHQRSLGLMFRPSLSNDHGMLFLFPSPDRYGIWMKNMLIPLDILWLDDQKRIIHIEMNVPPCPREPCLIYQPDTPALYVIELPAGVATRADLRTGLSLDWSASPESPPQPNAP
jgi:uncharacterized membrane protein (UPF0127 family)